MNIRNATILAATLCSLGLASCDGAPVESDAHRAGLAHDGDDAPEVASTAANAVDSPGTVANPKPPNPMGSDWQQFVAAELDRLRGQEPQLVDTLYALSPRSTRAGTMRLTGPLVRNPDAAVVFIDRLVSGKESPELRAALAEALPRTGGSFGPALVDLLADEPEATVRLAMTAALRTVDDASALRGLEDALRDADAGVRLTAARTIARRPDGAELADPLLAAAADEDAGVKLEAMRSLGALQVRSALDVLERALSSTDADARLVALRALARIDADHAADVPRVAALAKDDDPRVAKAAQQLLSRP